MNPESDKILPPEDLTVRRPYAKPDIQRVDLALAETLGDACKQTEPCPIDAPEFITPGS